MNVLLRKHFSTSRELDFFSEKELVAQTGHESNDWPLVILKELIDNALDAIEETEVAPNIRVEVTAEGISVNDNGPGIPEKVVEGVLDFTVRVSSREAYVAPCRGAQGNALMTVVSMPFVAFGGGSIVVEAQGIRHTINIEVDRIQQRPRVKHVKEACDRIIGTMVFVPWPNKASFTEEERRRFLQSDRIASDKASFNFTEGKRRFLQFADDYTWINPHLTLSVKWHDEPEVVIPASNPEWKKWLPSNPTDPHWYRVEELERLVAAHVTVNPEMTVRELVAEFRGLSGSAKQKAVGEASGLSRAKLAELIVDGDFDQKKLASLLEAMKANTKSVKPAMLGVIGKDHLLARAVLAGGDPDSFQYRLVKGEENGLSWNIETAFAYCPSEEKRRRIVTGVNWSPGINNPFRKLGAVGQSLDTVLSKQFASQVEPIVLVLHMSCPRVRYADRGKSSVIVEE